MPTHAPTAPADHDVTGILAEYVARATPEQLPQNVRKEAARTFLNWLGCAVGGCRHEAVDAALAALLPFSGPATASILGRGEKADPLTASLINGISSHVFDFDDTHLRTVIHPAGPLASALLAYAQHTPVSGIDFVNALVLGAEVSCRIGNAVFPEHYDIGWHITGSTGSLGAAAAIGKLMGLDTQHMTWALGIAASQPVGLREQFGSMTKSFHPGRAAHNGLTAALMAAKGYTASEFSLEAKRGWLNVLSARHDSGEITRNLGGSYEILINSYKPFACGIVLHPCIDACIQLHDRGGFAIEDISKVDLRVHPLVLELTGKTAPRDGLEGKFSVYHAAAVALIEGDGGENQFSDRAVTDAQILSLRQKVVAEIDPKMAPDAAALTLTLRNGQTLQCDVPHAIGSIDRPMSDADLEHKFTGLVQEHLPEHAIERLLSLCWGIEKLDSVAVIAQATQL